MIFTELFTGSGVSIDGTERSLMVNGGSTSLQSIDAARIYRLTIKLASVVAADNFKIRFYRKSNSGASQEVVDERHISFAMSRQQQFEFVARYGADITIQRISSNSRDATWSVEACETAPSVAAIQSGLATAAALDTVDNFLDTEVAAILAAVDTEIGSLATVVAALPTAAQNADAVWDEPLAGHAAAGSAGEALSDAAAGGGGGGSAWDELVADHDDAGSFGELLGDTIAAAVAAALAAILDVPTNAELATALDPIATAAEVTTDGALTRARLPAALVGGRIDASVGAMGAGVLTTTAIADGAVTSAKLADDAITAAKIQDGSITAAKIGTNAITSAKIGGNAITASALHADVTTELQAGLATAAGLTAAVAPLATSVEVAAVAAAVADVPTNAELAAALDPLPTNAELATAVAPLATAAALATVDTVADDIQTRATDIQGRIPTALVGGRMDSSVGAMAANVMTAAAAAADLGTELAAAVASALAASFAAIPAAVAGAVTIPTAAQVRDAVWGATLEGARSAAGLVRTIARLAVAPGTLPEDGEGTYTIRDIDNTKDAIVIEVDGDARTLTSLDDD